MAWRTNLDAIGVCCIIERMSLYKEIGFEAEIHECLGANSRLCAESSRNESAMNTKHHTGSRWTKHPARIARLDMDAFYASVDLLRYPKLFT